MPIASIALDYAVTDVLATLLPGYFFPNFVSAICGEKLADWL